MTDREWVDSIRKRWNLKGLELAPGVNEVNLLDVEKKLNFQFETSFKSLYLSFNGFNNSDWTSEMIAIFSLQQILETSTNRFIPFADHSIGVFFYGFIPNISGIFKVTGYSYDNPAKIADSFREVVELIDTGKDLLF